MKRIILLRHAKTEPYGYDKDDFQRNLTERGIADAHIITKAISKKGYRVDTIIASPANRAKQTAELFAEDFQIEKEQVHYYPEIYDGITTQEMLSLLAKADEQEQTLLFVGHNPDISRFAYRLTLKFEHYVPTCCAIVLETNITDWKHLGTQEFVFKDIFIPKNYK